MKKKDIIRLKIQDIKFPNKAYGEYEGVKVTVKNALPEQTVSAVITKKRSSGAQANLIEVIEKSPMEIEPQCKHFGVCGGCNYQNINYDYELELKKNQVLSLLEEANVDISRFEKIYPSPVLNGYRNKCEFSFGDEEKGGELALGMRKRGSFYEVVNLTDCNIIDKGYLEIIKATVEFFRKNDVPFYHKSKHTGALRHLVVRKSVFENSYLINLVTSSEDCFNTDDFVKALLCANIDGKIAGVLRSINDGLADVVKSEETTVLYGDNFITEKLFDLKFKITPFSFFQTNTKGAELLYSIVKDFAGDSANKVIFDLYCGTGTIAQVMAEKAKKVIGIEIVEEAVVAARENAEKNGITNCEFIAGDVLTKVDELNDKPDLIILDPPRDGIHPKAIGKIANFEAKELAYVSCKLTSLARDLPILAEYGYEVKRIACADMFPRTGHVECVVLMSKVQK